MSQVKSTFDFRVYDAIMQNAGPGLKIILAKQLLSDVSEAAQRFNHPLKKDLADITVEVEGLRAMWKAIAADANKRKAA